MDVSRVRPYLSAPEVQSLELDGWHDAIAAKNSPVSITLPDFFIFIYVRLFVFFGFGQVYVNKRLAYQVLIGENIFTVHKKR